MLQQKQNVPVDLGEQFCKQTRIPKKKFSKSVLFFRPIGDRGLNLKLNGTTTEDEIGRKNNTDFEKLRLFKTWKFIKKDYRIEKKN